MQVTWSGAGLKDLLLGIVCILFAIIAIISVFAYTLGYSGGEGVVVKQEGISGLFVATFSVLVIGVLGGVEIGRYVEKTMNEKKKQISSPPPP